MHLILSSTHEHIKEINSYSGLESGSIFSGFSGSTISYPNTSSQSSQVSLSSIKRCLGWLHASFLTSLTMISLFLKNSLLCSLDVNVSGNFTFSLSHHHEKGLSRGCDIISSRDTPFSS
jgi:hypothetical protein